MTRFLVGLCYRKPLRSSTFKQTTKIGSRIADEMMRSPTTFTFTFTFFFTFFSFLFRLISFTYSPRLGYTHHRHHYSSSAHGTVSLDSNLQLLSHSSDSTNPRPFTNKYASFIAFLSTSHLLQYLNILLFPLFHCEEDGTASFRGLLLSPKLHP